MQSLLTRRALARGDGDAADVLVMGAGPAGLAAAAACARLGLRVVCVAPSPFDVWRRSFAVWSCELTEMACADVVEATWARPSVWLDEQTHLPLPHSYSRLDVARFQRALLAACEGSNVALRAGAVVALDHDARGSVARLSSGERVRARTVVDATGPESPFVARVAVDPPAFQTAYGELCELDRPLDMTLMDYRGEDGGGPPSFLYALPLPDGRVFVEETVLASRPAVPFALLATRLGARLDRMGVARLRVFEHEHCTIPMGVSLPRANQRVIPFGAAASAVHPATGYQVARTLAQAPALARAIAGASSPDEAARRAREVVWPLSRRASWGLFTFGMETICAFDLRGLRAFLRAFFALPDASWLGFLRGTSSPLAIAVAMARVLVAADPAVRDAILRLLPRQHRTLTRPLMLEEGA
ncbi:MAG: lycopene cyclase family protein [Myxococcales bacterium]|nr:lycopene cyclase family protein [Myxococcales bacterium]